MSYSRGDSITSPYIQNPVLRISHLPLLPHSLSLILFLSIPLPHFFFSTPLLLSHPFCLFISSAHFHHPISISFCSCIIPNWSFNFSNQGKYLGNSQKTKLIQSQLVCCRQFFNRFSPPSSCTIKLFNRST